MNKYCVICGTGFKVRSNNHICCSVQCREKHNPSHQARKNKPISKKCKICSTTFFTTHYQHMTCSSKCSIKNAQLINKKTNQQPKWIAYHKEHNKVWYLKNKEELKLVRAKCHQKYKKIKQQKKLARIKSDPIFRLSLRIRDSLKKRLESGGYAKKHPTLELLGWDFVQLKSHLENQFTSKMCWNNYGSYWNIDHIVPLSWFKTKNQVIKKGWALKNLQPLEKDINFSKNNLFVGNPKTSEVIYL